ncbi:ectodysplasin-A-like isoform X4 [Asterias rubens]|uniref:ectodysplasin-A-like isoform X4 n=1 Tax=Asterias rubens TaxID=7604 RepID=UPI0014552B28|nr:ectodysplasin-A-like isoform X4 [Asterias rubens]
MQEQRSWQLGLVVACLVSCGLVGMIVIVNQSSSEISSLHSVLRAQESRISILEIQNRNLHLVLENIQWKLNKKEHNPMKTDGDHVARRLSTSDLPPNSVNQGALDAEVFGDRKAKGDDGAFIEGDRVTEEKARSEEKDDFHLRTFRSTRNQRDKEGRKACKRCKGKKGEPGRTSFGGEKGAKGERGHRGPPGECEHSTTTDSTTPRQGTQPHQYSVILSAHFEGDVESPAIVERWDPINRGYVDLSDFDGGWVPYWKYADWMDSDVRSRFILGQTGNVTVTEGGIYYVYSQMLYYDPSVFMGHSLYIGEQKRFSCTECTVDRDRKFNTCYIGGVVQINNGDKVGIRVSYANRVINLHPDSTHFGLIKLS